MCGSPILFAIDGEIASMRSTSSFSTLVWTLFFAPFFAFMRLQLHQFSVAVNKKMHEVGLLSPVPRDSYPSGTISVSLRKARKAGSSCTRPELLIFCADWHTVGGGQQVSNIHHCPPDPSSSATC